MNIEEAFVEWWDKYGALLGGSRQACKVAFICGTQYGIDIAGKEVEKVFVREPA